MSTPPAGDGRPRWGLLAGEGTRRLPEPRRLLAWVYVGRLALVLAVFLAALLAWREVLPGTTLSVTLLLVVTGAFTASSVWLTHLSGHALSRSTLYAQILFDVAVVTWVVTLTGREESAFAFLYILVICAAGILLPLSGGILIGVLCSVLYFASAVLDAGASPSSGVLLQSALFTVVALATGYLGDRLRQTGAVLGEVEAELALLRLDTDDILGSIGTAILTVDGGERLVYINPAAAEILSLPPSAWLGRPILELLDERAEGLGEVIRRTVEGRQAIRRFETTDENGRGMVLGVSTTLVERSARDATTVTAIFQDITERKRMDALRLRAERLEAVAELSASLAHEIKNPLASIRSAVEQLAGEKVDAEDRELLETLVIRESDRLSRLLAEFIDFARVRVGGGSTVDLREVVQQAVGLIRAHPDAEGRTLETVFPTTDPLLLRGNEDLLHRAVANLVLNAVQWAGPEGRVEISLDSLESDLLLPELGRSRLLRLSVADSGPGVAAEDVDQIFHPFFTARAGGTGLGLALVQRAVEGHGGAVFVDNARAGVVGGAVFTVYLPALQGGEELPDRPGGRA
ncbi:MAG: ATP-binding protein [Gemmatimonadota bacterium]|nr:ATP-binding protein [Gemmatimonadota bacterium]